MLRLRSSFDRRILPLQQVTRLLSGNKWQPNMRSRHGDASCQKQNEDRKAGWKKKKVSLVFGYVGKDYRGLQMIDPAMNTVEREVEAALFNLGCILPTNRQSLDKIGWSRSSRTDKGVHAARIVVSAKLLLSPEWLFPQRALQGEREEDTETGEEEEAQSFPGMVEQLNRLLPPAVRAFSCTRVNKGFQAREACHWREYEYLIPARLVLSAGAGEAACTSSAHRWKEDVQSQEEFVGRLNEVFSLMEGSKSMHNFHRKKSSKHEVQRKQEQQLARQERSSPESSRGGGGNHVPMIGRDIMWESEGSVEQAEVEPREGCSDEEGGDSDAEQDEEQEQEKPFRLQYEHWQPRLVKEGTKGSLYHVRAVRDTKKMGEEGEDMVCIRLRGQGFLMNQIRLMVSAAVLYARGIIPLDLVHLSLDSPYRCAFPLAPAEGLLLVDSGYSRNVSGQSYSLHPYHEEQIELQDSSSSVSTLMTAEEYDCSEEFKRRSIYQEVLRDWGGDDSHELISKWFLHCEEYFISPNMHAKMKTLLDDYKAFTAPQQQIKFELYSRRVSSYRERFQHAAVQDAKNRLAESCLLSAEEEEGVDTISSSRKDAKKFKKGTSVPQQVEFPHKLFLPNGTSAALIVKFNLLPSGPVITQALRALALAVAEGGGSVPPVFVDAAHVVQHVSSTEGGIYAWAERKPTSPLIM